jgi:hypothetical protein
MKYETKIRIIKIMYLVGVLIGFALGMLIGITQFNQDTSSTTSSQVVEGKYTSHACNFEGEWVHVNITDMPYKRALEVCSHEVGHEIFAEVCEKNMTKCEEVLK